LCVCESRSFSSFRLYLFTLCDNKPTPLPPSKGGLIVIIPKDTYRKTKEEINKDRYRKTKKKINKDRYRKTKEEINKDRYRKTKEEINKDTYRKTKEEINKDTYSIEFTTIGKKKNK